MYQGTWKESNNFCCKSYTRKDSSSSCTEYVILYQFPSKFVFFNSVQYYKLVNPLLYWRGGKYKGQYLDLHEYTHIIHKIIILLGCLSQIRTSTRARKFFTQMLMNQNIILFIYVQQIRQQSHFSIFQHQLLYATIFEMSFSEIVNETISNVFQNNPINFPFS